MHGFWCARVLFCKNESKLSYPGYRTNYVSKKNKQYSYKQHSQSQSAEFQAPKLFKGPSGNAHNKKQKHLFTFPTSSAPKSQTAHFFGGQIFWAWSQLLQRLTCFPGSLIQDGFVSFSSVFYCHTLISLPSEADPDPERCWMTLEPISLPVQRQLPVQRGLKHSPRDRRRRQHSMRLQSTSFHFQIWRWLWDCNRPVAEREGQILFLFLFS